MEASSTPSTSKVILQCTDPSNLLEDFESRLTIRTPLKNLHWKSPSRPLRSIPSLNISLVRKDAAQNGAESTIRRHQIPGLRETPYVKLYLLRCDDKEIYKETARKEIKQWIRENTFEKEKKSALKNHEHHDAFEWMIVHVVISGTAAANQPASSKHISLNDTESTDSINSKSKWTGKSTSTIYDKLRADFSSSKSAIPRVAQVRLQEPGKPPGALAPSEVEEQWQDFVDNLKATILKSFDTRVAQYEDDIRERESQRTLPGWNFCTFFMLKEGLARGFENVGLLDDALTVYAELEVGLDNVVKEHANREEPDPSAALLPFSKDLKADIRRALDESVHQAADETSFFTLREALMHDIGDSPFGLERRTYRDLILANEVSPLDVRTYLFVRQMEILLRRARLTTTSAIGTIVDLDTMADLAELALNFINLGSRELRADMHAAWGGKVAGEERTLQRVVIGNAVASWTWQAVMHMLDVLLPTISLDLSSFDQSVDILEEDARLDRSKKLPQTPNGRSPTSSASPSPRRGLRPESLSRALSRSPAVPEDPSQGGLRRPGHDRLMSTVGRMFLLARKTIENLPAATPWVNALRNLNLAGYEHASRKLHRLSSPMSVQLVNDKPEHQDGDSEQHEKPQPTLRGLKVVSLAKSASSKLYFYDLYRLLSRTMHHLYVEAGNKHSARQAMIDLAMLAYAQDDLGFARQCLGTVAGPKSQDPVVAAQPHVLALYAECLQDAERPNDLANCLVACLRAARSQVSPQLAQQQYDQLTSIAGQTSDLRLPLSTIAEPIRIDRAIRQHGGPSGFTLSVLMRASVPVELHGLGSATLKLRALDQQDPLSLWLQCDEVPMLGQSPQGVAFSTNISTDGWYAIELLEMWMGKIRFEYNLQNERDEYLHTGVTTARSMADIPPVRAYLPADSVRLKACQSRVADLRKRQCLTLSVMAASHGISKCALRIKPRTAGLRLALHEASVQGEDDIQSMDIVHENDATFLRFDQLKSSATVVISIPYTIENQQDMLLFLKCTLEGMSNDSKLAVYQTCSLRIALPVSVNVQDVYRNEYWYSHFLVGSATPTPIQLLGCELETHDEIGVESSQVFATATTVFEGQPAQWLTRMKNRGSKQVSSNKPLTLKVSYHALDEVALGSVRAAFSSAASEAGMSAIAELLSSHLLDMLSSSWTESDLELLGLTHEVRLLDEAECHWDAVLGAFDRKTRDDVRSWLRKWHNQQPVPLKFENDMVRELYLNVDERPRPPVVTAELQPQLPTTRITAVLGQPLTCHLVVSVTGKHEEGLQWSYEILSPPETWLIGGKRKGLFTPRDGVQAPVVLFSQRTGLLMLPVIDIRCRRPTGDKPHEMDNVMGELPVEIYNKSSSTAIQVTLHLRSATIGLGADEVASQPRQSGSGISSDLLLQSQERSDE
jgi:trafficking protein particle complex subunit 10